MPRLSLEVAHALGQEEAMRRLKEKFSAARDMYQNQVNDLQDEWSGETYNFGFKAMGLKIAGSLQVAEAAVRLSTDLPMAAMLFKKAIEQRVRQELDAILA